MRVGRRSSTLALASLVAQGSLGGYLDDYCNEGPAFLESVRLPDADLAGNSTAGATAGRSWAGYALNVTSQAWLTEDDWGAPWGGEGARWWHYVYVIIPSVVSDAAADWRSIYITGGKNTDRPYDPDDLDIAATAQLAMATEQVFVALFQVPNCKIYFKAEEGQPENDENEMLAKTFVHFMNDAQNTNNMTLNQASWAVLLPMTKSVFAGMAATDEFLSSDEFKALAPPTQSTSTVQTKWVVTGASKRGWAAWLVGAVDAARQAGAAAGGWPQKVVGIAPLVMDGLNFHEYLHLQYGAYGGWSWAMEAFWEAGFLGRIDTPEFAQLFDVIDPFAYIARYAGMPKLVGDATGDEFFVLTDQRNWVDEMPGPTYLTMNPDSPHALTTALPSLLPSMAGFIHRLIYNGTESSSAAPALSFTTDYGSNVSDASIIVTVECNQGGGVIGADDCDLPRTVRLWTAESCLGEAPRRDFRMINIDGQTLEGGCGLCGVAYDPYCLNLKAGLWRNETLRPDLVLDPSGRTYRATQAVPPVDEAKQAWVAFFVSATFHGAAPSMPNGSSARSSDIGEHNDESCEAHPIEKRRFCIPVTRVGDIAVTTTVAVLPDRLPFECSGEGCTGYLL